MVADRLRKFTMREPFLCVLVLLYFLLLVRDGSLLRRTPGLIDWAGLSLIASLILVSKGLELSGAFTRLSSSLILLSNGSERRLAFLLLPAVALSSAVIMNDTAMLVFIPLVVTVSRVTGKDLSALVVLSAIAANVGSALTPIGNPQNIIIWSYYGPSFLGFLTSMLPFVGLWLVLLLVFAGFVFRGGIPGRRLPPVALRKGLLWASVVLLPLDVLLFQEGRPLLTFPLTLAVLLLAGRDVLLGFDWALLLTFALIFVDFGEISGILSSLGLSPPGSPMGLFLASALTSQAVSNVPATVLLLGGKDWLPLAVGVNVGGTGFVLGSLANLIAVRISGISMRDFHRYSLPYFLAAVLLSALLLAWLGVR